MNTKKLIVAKAFRDRDGRDHKPGDRIEVDPDYAVEIIRKGDARDDPEASQQPA